MFYEIKKTVMVFMIELTALVITLSTSIGNLLCMKKIVRRTVLLERMKVNHLPVDK